MQWSVDLLQTAKWVNTRQGYSGQRDTKDTVYGVLVAGRPARHGDARDVRHETQD